MVWSSVAEFQWDSVVPSPYFPELTDLGLSFMLAVCMSLSFDCCWVFLWWVLPSSWLIEGHSVHHVLHSEVQMWTVCVEAVSSVCIRFEASLLLLSSCLFWVISLLLYFQICPGLRLVWLPLRSSPAVVICWWFLCWWVSSSSRCTCVHCSHLASSLE